VPSCREVVELITEYLEGALSQAEREAVEHHLAVCRGCQAYLEQVRHVVRLTGRLAEEEIPPEIRAELVSAFRNWSG
jgi:anti-sigma factor RsiW